MTAGLSLPQKQAVLGAAKPHGLRLLGPNCLGLLRPQLGLNASFTHANALPGDLALVSQSGALLTALLDWANTERIGFSHLISLGEHLDVDFGDLLDYLATDRQTRAILLYIESIPYWETRGYVTTVLRNYWMYEGKDGRLKSPSRAALAQGMWPKFPGLPGPSAVRLTPSR